MQAARIPIDDCARLASPVPCGARYRYARRHLRWLCAALDGFAGPLVAAARRIRPARPACRPQSILIVQLDHIGDAVLSAPMIRAVHDAWPASTIDVVASQSNEEIFRSHPLVRHVHVSRHNWLTRGAGGQSYLAEAARLGRLLRHSGYDLGIDPRGDFLVALTLWLAGIPRRAGWSCGGGGFIYTDRAAWDPSRHELESRRALLECLDIRAPNRLPEVFPTWADQCHVRERLAALRDPQSRVAVLHIGAGTPAKRWPGRHLSRFVPMLAETLSGSIILVGDRDDQAAGRQLARSRPGVLDWTGRLTLLQLAALLGEAELFVGADSGPAHIAAAMGTPSVVFFSGTNRAECWAPRGPQVRIVRSGVPCAPCHSRVCPVEGHPCMARLRPDDVLDVVRDLLSTSRKPGDRMTAFCRQPLPARSGARLP